MFVDCAYCFNVEDKNQHELACPIFLGTKQAMSDWKRGFLSGKQDFEVNELSKKDLNNKTFILGHDYGVRAIVSDEEPLESL